MRWLILFLLLPLPAPAKRPEGQMYACYMTIQWVIKHNRLYQQEHGKFAPKLTDLDPNIRPCPWSRLDYVYRCDGKSYLIYCPGHHHKIDGARPDHPRYSSKTGAELR